MRKTVFLLLFAVLIIVTGCTPRESQEATSQNTLQETNQTEQAATEAPAAGTAESSGNDTTGAHQGSVSIGITQIVEHPSLDAIREGVLAALAEAGYVPGKTLAVDYENAQGDRTVATDIAHKFAGKPLDLVIAITTPSAQAVQEAIQDKPIVFAAVSDPLAAGLVEDLNRPGGHITGSSDQTPLDQEIALILKFLPQAQTIGIIYNSGEANAEAQLKQAEQAATAQGIKVIARGISQANEIPLAVDALGSQVDAFLTLNDNLVVSAIDNYLDRANILKKPVFASDPESVDKGAVATYGIDQYKLGVRTGELAVRVLKGEDPGTIPVLIVQDTFLKVNEAAIKGLGLKLSDDLEKEIAAAQANER
ncbi:MAG: ABC transporter substrate-binding protein [Candidatus Carbobacillus altaicus]|nr:ABC transporter substrate-binding protein [Candidatus Carbobacillus altaicus]